MRRSFRCVLTPARDGDTLWSRPKMTVRVIATKKPTVLRRVKPAATPRTGIIFRFLAATGRCLAHLAFQDNRPLTQTQRRWQTTVVLAAHEENTKTNQATLIAKHAIQASPPI